MSRPVDLTHLLVQFHHKFKFPFSMTPTGAIDPSVKELRRDLMVEELAEVLDAMKTIDYEQIAKELADLVYVVYGTAITYGIDLNEVILAVHASNMGKVDCNGNPIYDPDTGKLMKGPNYKPPHMASLLAVQRPLLLGN